MKSSRILQMALLTTIVVLAISCGPSRAYYYDRPVQTRASLSLVINPWTGIVISRYPDGRYFYRSPEGYIYWRGYDNRYYLDRNYIGKVHYNQREYNDWRYSGRRRHR